MELVHVIPIARGVRKETLSYFSGRAECVGTIVFVPLRGRLSPALVVRRESVADAKARLRSSSFPLRKISSRKPVVLLTPAFINAAEDTARYFVQSVGYILFAVLPQIILEAPEKTAVATQKNVPPRTATIPEKLILQTNENERLARYRSIIRESFARRHSVLITTPTIADSQRLEGMLSKGIEPYTLVLTSNLTKKNYRNLWQRACSETHPVLIIGTPSVISLPRPDLATIIVERENSPYYKLANRPFIDFRYFIERVAYHRHVRFIRGDAPLSIETMWRFEQDKLGELVSPHRRLESKTSVSLIDMRVEAKRTGKPFSILSDTLHTQLTHTHEQKGWSFLFAARRGLAGTTVCRDCSAVVVGKDGQTPMTLYKSEGGNIFVSHATGEIRSAHERCRVCKSWRLEALGIGIERVEEAVGALVPPEYIFRIDRDTTKTYKQAFAEAQAFYDTPGSILLGTEAALPFLSKTLSTSAVVSLDSLLSMPGWRIPERIFSILTRLRELSSTSLVVQTRHAKTTLLHNALEGNIGTFYKDEIELRRKLSFPPFTVLIKLTIVGTPARVKRDMERLEELFKDFDVHVYSASIAAGRGRYASHGLIRVPRSAWPHPKLIDKLSTLPPAVAVEVDPENLL